MLSQLIDLIAGIPRRRPPKESPLPLPRSRTAIGTLAAALALCATPATAAGVSISPLKRCYVSVGEGRTEPVALSASGFAANSAVDVSLDGTPVATVTATADGQVHARMNPPHQARGQRTFRVGLQQRDDPARHAEATSRVTALAVKLRPRSAQPRSVVTWTGRGFTAAGPVYVHYLKDGEIRRSVRLETPRKACGIFRARRAQFPFRPSLGEWILQIDQQRAFAPFPETPFVQLPVTVRRVARDS